MQKWVGPISTLQKIKFFAKIHFMIETEDIKEKNNSVTSQALEGMYSSGLHLGYSATSCHPKMKPYIFGLRNGVEIFDLDKVKKSFDLAKNFVKELGREKKVILFVGTKKESRDVVEKNAGRLGMPFVKERWIGGTLTNFKQIKSRIDYLSELKKKRETGDLDKYTKKERLQIERKIEKMELYFGGLVENFKFLPSAVLVIDPKHEKTSINEANQMKIPTISLLNSDCDPSKISYPAPGNDNSLSSVLYFIEEMVKSYEEGLTSAQPEIVIAS